MKVESLSHLCEILKTPANNGGPLSLLFSRKSIRCFQKLSDAEFSSLEVIVQNSQLNSNNLAFETARVERDYKLIQRICKLLPTQSLTLNLIYRESPRRNRLNNDARLLLSAVEGCCPSLKWVFNLNEMLESSADGLSFDWTVFQQHKYLQVLHVEDQGIYYMSAIRLSSLVTGLVDLSLREFLVDARLSDAQLFSDNTPTQPPNREEQSLLTRFLSSPTLTSLRIQQIRFETGPMCRAFCQGLVTSSSLAKLELGLYCASEHLYKLVFDALERMTSLEWLVLATDDEDGQFELPLRVANIVGSNKQLTKLEVCNANLDLDLCIGLGTALCEASCKLQELKISHCAMPLPGVTAILQAIPSGTQLHTLSLGYYLSGAGEADSLVAQLHSLAATAIKRIHLEKEDSREDTASDASSRALLKRWEGNYQFHELIVDCLDDNWLHELATLGQLNQAGRSYVASGPNKRLCVQVLGQVSDNLNHVLTHLRETPDVFRSEEAEAEEQR